MAVCNLFCNTENLKETGTFLTFSQYLEDLTQHNSDGVSYNIRPSSFFAIDLDFNNYDVCKDLMINVENYCACLRNKNIMLPEYFYHMLWQTLAPRLKREEENTNLFYGYKGEVTIQSFDKIDGMGYSELYCHIPYTSKKQIWQITTDVDFPDDNNTTIDSGDHLEGYPKREIDPITYTLNQCILAHDDDSNEMYSFNTIIVFYDLCNGLEKIQENIPLGIFFTGKIIDGVMTNAVNITPNSEETYYSGSSYGLKICSRFATNDEPNILNITETQYDDLNLVLEQISKSQNLMQEIVKKCDQFIAENKTLNSMLKDSRTNVPYIKEVKIIKDGTIQTEPHWFVNGRDLGYSIYSPKDNKID